MKELNKILVIIGCLVLYSLSCKDETKVVSEDKTEVVSKDKTEVVSEEGTEVVGEEGTEVVGEEETEVVGIELSYPSTYEDRNLDQLCSGKLTKGLIPEITYLFGADSNLPARLSKFKIEPQLPAGLEMNDRGVISGEMTGYHKDAHTITAYYGDELAGSTTIDLSIMALADQEFYISDHFTFEVGTEVPQLRMPLPESFAGRFSYSISPDLPSGLVFSGTNGNISGIPAEAQERTAYVVTVQSEDCIREVPLEITLSSLPNRPPVFSGNTQFYLPPRVAIHPSGTLISEIREGKKVPVARITGFSDPEEDSLSYRIVSQTQNNPEFSTYQMEGDQLYLFGADFRRRDKGGYLYVFKYESDELMIEARDPNGNTAQAVITMNLSDRWPSDCDRLSSEEERKECTYITELLPENWQDNVLTSTEKARLPALTKEASEYRLVLGEEFDYSPVLGEYNGYENLDPEIWSYVKSDTQLVDSAGKNCTQIKGGSLEIGFASGCGRIFLSTRGLLEHRYGYLEIQYRLPLKKQFTSYVNIPTVLWSRFVDEAPNLGFYSPRTIENREYYYGYYFEDGTLEGHLKYGYLEYDFMEFIPHIQRAIAHFRSGALIPGGNIYPNTVWTEDINFIPFVAIKRDIWFCQRNGPFKATNLSLRACETVSSNANPSVAAYVTYVRGVEWTPAGYREFYRFATDDPRDRTQYSSLFHDDLRLVRSTRYSLTSDGSRVGQRFRTRLTPNGSMNSYIQSRDTADHLIDLMVYHQPMALQLDPWGQPEAHETQVGLRKIHIDHIRLYKPVNNYADVEPVYRGLDR